MHDHAVHPSSDHAEQARCRNRDLEETGPGPSNPMRVCMKYTIDDSIKGYERRVNRNASRLR